jgi:hypothetical protein
MTTSTRLAGRTIGILVRPGPGFAYHSYFLQQPRYTIQSPFHLFSAQTALTFTFPSSLTLQSTIIILITRMFTTLSAKSSSKPLPMRLPRVSVYFLLPLILMTPSTPASSPVSAGVIAGATVGGVVLVSIALFAFIFYRKRARQRLPLSEKNIEEPSFSIPPSVGETPAPATRQEQYPTTTTPVTDFEPPTTTPLPKATPTRRPTVEKDGHLLSPGSTSSGRELARPTHPTSGPLDTAPNFTLEPPPVYGNSSVLSTWASSNRAVVSEDMEAKLLAAGYMPGDDPDAFTEDEWQSRYGLTRLELLRLRRLYSRYALCMSPGRV